MLKKAIITLVILILLMLVVLGGLFYFSLKHSVVDQELAAPSQQLEMDKLWPLAKKLAGYDSEKTYLMIFQNNHEMRPTGGFIGSYGLLKMKDGKVTEMNLDDSYALDRPAEEYLRVEPPKPIKDYMANYWWFRDANWSPDFPTAAEQLIWFYQQEGGQEKIDGVIAFDPEIISDILGVVGPITVGEVEFKEDGFTDLLEYEVEMAYHEKGIEKSDRKDILAVLAKELMQKVESASYLDMFGLFNILTTNLQSKHILVYDTDSAIQEQLVNNGWAGEVKKTPRDYLMVVDANMVALKTDRVVDKEISYDLRENAAGEMIAVVTLRYNNNGEYDYRTSRLRSYTRIYVPYGSELINYTGAMNNDRGELADQPGEVQITNELSKTVFGWFWYINPGETRTVVMEYRLPAELAKVIKQEKAYTLFVQKQPGTTGHQLEVDVKLGGLQKAWETDLSVDRVLRIEK